MSPEIKSMAAQIVRAFNERIKSTLQPLLQRVSDAELAITDAAQQLREMPKPQRGEPGLKGDTGDVGARGERGESGDTGEPGRDGRDGKDADPALIREEVAKAVAQIPPPKDGESVDMADLAGKIAAAATAAATAATAALPRPKDGVDGKSVELGDLWPLVDRSVEMAFAALPLPRDGRDADPAVISAEVTRAVQALPKADPDAIAVVVLDQVVAALPAPPKGEPGKDADPELIRSEVAKAVALIPQPKDGESVPADQVRRMVDEAVTAAMAAVRVPRDGEGGRDGRDGKDGRDALEIEVVPAIDFSKSYARGTFAQWGGGIVRAVRNTDPLKDGELLFDAGWTSIVRGLSAVTLEQTNERSFELVLCFNDGVVERKAFSMPVLLYRGIWTDKGHERGDTVTWDGSMWHCEAATTDKPGTSDRWKLCAKRGRDGRDGLRGEKGERGSEGKQWKA